MQTWLTIPADSDFSIHNLPFGIFSTKKDPEPRTGVAIGDWVIDIDLLNCFDFGSEMGLGQDTLHTGSLNELAALGPTVRKWIRTELQRILTTESGREKIFEHEDILLPMSEVTMHMPVRIGDYTDFYASEDHARNIGTMFRDPANALLPNWKHLPVGYHGRASSIVPSGVRFKRPHGQTRPNDAEPPVYGPTRALDFELEVAHIIGTSTALGDTVSVDQAEDYVFGFVLFNDWSARDIQKWEYVPLGPFLGKNFCSSISCWVVTPEALAPFRVDAGKQDPEVLPYLRGERLQNFNVQLEVSIAPAGGAPTVVSRSNFKYMYWTVAQQIAHHTVNGCPLNVGDMMASGTISGPTPDSYGSMQELTWGGKNPIVLSDGSERRYIQDGDTVTMRGFAERDGVRVGFGEVSSGALAG
jgi:fumarylacetoacetase